MNHLNDISSTETVKSILEQIETDFIVLENDKPRLPRCCQIILILKKTARRREPLKNSLT